MPADGDMSITRHAPECKDPECIDPECNESAPKCSKTEQGSNDQKINRGDDEQSPAKKLRFTEGQRVVCNISIYPKRYLWRTGTVVEVAHHDDDGTIVPYYVKLDNGTVGVAPEDDDECIRLAARASADYSVLRLFALPEDKRKAIDLRFIEGDRVAVQLDTRIWEEGVVVEVWTIPTKNGKPFQTWGGMAVPYAVNLDLGHTVLIPFDTDEVIRAECAARPAQKSVAEQIDGTERPSTERFIRRQNSSGKWVRVDTKTGVERPCAAPCSHDH